MVSLYFMEWEKFFLYSGSEKVKSKSVLFFLTLLLFLFIPFQQRLYKLLRPLSQSLIDPSWNLPEYFEIHLDGYISDFVILAVIFFCTKRGIRWRSFFWEGERKYLTLFLVISLISIFNSGFASYPLLYWRWLHLALPAFLFYFLSRKPLEEGNFTKIAQIVLAAGLIECAIAIPQYFIQHSLGLKGLGEATLIATHYIGSNFPMSDGSVWIFDRFFHGIRDHLYVIRAYGTLPHPNVLGGFMVFSLLITAHLYGRAKKRTWLGLALFIQMFSLFTTYSRSAIFSGAFAMVLWIAVTSWREKKINSLFWVASSSFLLSVGLLYPQLFHRGGIVSYNVVSQNSDSLRMTIQDVGVAMFRAHPFLGVGFNNYMIAFQKVAGGQALPATYIHNVYLHLAVEVGILGALSLLAFCFMVVRRGWKNVNSPEVLTPLSIFIAFLCIGLADYYPLCVQQTRLIFFMMAGLLLAPQSPLRKSMERIEK
jgi:hypothetical protein